MLRASIASLACLALCLPVLAQKTETDKSRSTKETSRPPSSTHRAPTETKAKAVPERSMTMQQEEAARLAKQRREEEEARRSTSSRPPSHTHRAPTETKARTMPERSMTMQQEEAARLAKQRREEEEMRRALYRQQQQDNLRGRRFYPDPVYVDPVPQQQPQPQVSPGLGSVGPVTAPAITPAASRDIVVSCSAAPACPGTSCRSVASTYGGGNAATVGRRDIATLCQQANSADACCAQECANAARCSAQ